MADAFWMQLGGNLTFALEVGGQIVGIAYWVDPEGLVAQGVDDESGWYFLSTSLPRHPERVAQGLELRRDMTEAEMAQTVQEVLEVVANEVLAEGDE
jgi:hypothetical protein